MRAVTMSGFGDPSVLGWGEVPDVAPPGPGQVVLTVAATAVNRADLMQRLGFYPPPPGESETLGLECAGTVAAVGPDVDGWAVGDQACALLAGGGYAEQVLVPAAQLLPVPAGVSLEVAGAIPEVACTVWSNVLDRGALQPGEVFLVHGGTSGIGTMAIQVAKAVGATVAVTARSAEKLERCRELGADIGVNYSDEDFVEKVRDATGGHGADLILDTVGAKYLARNVDLLADEGRMVTIGLVGGIKAELNLAQLLNKRGAVHATSLRGRTPAGKAAVVAGTRRDIWPMIEDGRVKPVVHCTLPMAEAAEAHRLVDSSEHIGKVLLTP